MRQERTAPVGATGRLNGVRGRWRGQHGSASPKRRVAAVVLVAALAGATALAATTAQAQTGGPTKVSPVYSPITVFSPKGQSRGRWSERIKVAGDLNRDGINDLWVAVPQYQRDQPNDNDAADPDRYGRVYAVDGASLAAPGGQKRYPQILYKIHPPEPQLNKQFGFQLENIGDVNDDGTADIVVGTDAQNVPVDPKSANTQNCDLPNDQDDPRCFENMGKAWVFDGKTNRVLYELNNPEPQGSNRHTARFGSRLGKAGDINGDGASEVLAGASNNDEPAGCSDTGVVGQPGCRRNEGRAYMFDGKTGELVRTFKLPEEDDPRRPCDPRSAGQSCGNFGLTVQGPGDVDGDGTPDQLVGAPGLQVPFEGGNRNQGRMYVFSGKTGDVIRRIDDPQPQTAALFGFEDVTPLDPGDINGDGKAEIYGHGFQQAGEGGDFQGKSWVFNGGAGNATGTPVMYELDNPDRRRCKSFGWSMTRDRDRTTAGPPVAPGEDDNNPLYVGNDPHHCTGAPPELQKGETNLFHPLNGGRNPVAGASTPDSPPPGSLDLPPPFNTEGDAVPLPPAQGPDEPAPRATNLGPNLGWTTASPGDLNRDGFRDFLGGAPFTNVCHVRLGTMNKEQYTDEGVMIAFVSNPENQPPPPNDRNPADNTCEELPSGEGGVAPVR